MLTDTEVAETTRRLLSDELASVNPRASLLADVRARHARAMRARRAATAALASITTVAAAAGIATAAGSLTRSTPQYASAAASQSPAARTGAQTRTIVLDGYEIRVRTGLRLTVRPHGQLTATFAGHAITLTLTLHGGPVPAAAARVSGWHRPAYLLNDGGQLSLYVPFPVAAPGYHSLVVSGARLTAAELLRIAAAISVDGRPGFLTRVPHPGATARCPCG